MFPLNVEYVYNISQMELLPPNKQSRLERTPPSTQPFIPGHKHTPLCGCGVTGGPLGPVVF